jgi:hypothetical protein
MDTNYKFVYPSTKVLLLNGISKVASELQVGDILLSPDPHDDRTIMTITPLKSANYMVIPRYCNSPFIVSEYHMLPVAYESKIVLINIKTHPALKFKNFISLIHESTDFTPIFVSLEPYILGLWLTNNNTNEQLKFSKHNIETTFFMLNFIEKFNLQYESDDISLTLTDKRFIAQFQKYDLFVNPRIPDDYKYNNKSIRSRILSGFIDNNITGPTDIAINSRVVKDDFCFLVHSLGFLTQTKKKNSIWYVTVVFNAVSLTNDFKIAKIEDDDCLCLEISGNSAGIILSDFTVI